MRSHWPLTLGGGSFRQGFGLCFSSFLSRITEKRPIIAMQYYFSKLRSHRSSWLGIISTGVLDKSLFLTNKESIFVLNGFTKIAQSASFLVGLHSVLVYCLFWLNSFPIFPKGFNHCHAMFCSTKIAQSLSSALEFLLENFKKCLPMVLGI